MLERSPRFPHQPPMRVVWVRWLTVAAPMCYLAGAAIDAFELGPKQGAMGSLLVIAALLAVVGGLYATGIARIFQEHVQFLDDAERLIRAQVLDRSYQVFTGVIVVAIFATEITLDLDRKFEWALEFPSGIYSLVAGAVIIFALVLPTGLLAWRLPVEEPIED
ncbi:MAG: hypothetical protein AAGE01_11085 [Pseudomonadota bacterium]